MASKIQIKRGLKGQAPVLLAGELGFATDTKELLIGTGSGNVIFAKEKIVTAVLTAVGWTGTETPFSQTISVAGVTAASKIEIVANGVWSNEQVLASAKSILYDGGQGANRVTLLAVKKPLIDLPIKIIVGGDLSAN